MEREDWGVTGGRRVREGGGMGRNEAQSLQKVAESCGNGLRLLTQE